MGFGIETLPPRFRVFAIKRSLQTWAGESPILTNLLAKCAARGFVSESFSSSSPINASVYENYVAFLNGGIMGIRGNYFPGLRGAWVWGRRALHLACYDLGLAHPRFRGDTKVALPLELLLSQAEQQLRTEDAALRARVSEMQLRLTSSG